MNNTDHKSTELARLFYLELTKVDANPDWTPPTKADALARLLELLFLEVTRAEGIQFTTLFARIAYACHRHQVEKQAQYWVHLFRKKMRAAVPEKEAKAVYNLGLKAIAESIEGLFGEAPPAEVKAFLPKKIPYTYAEVQVSERRKHVRVVALADDEANDLLLAQDEENPSQLIGIQYNIPDRNENFGPTIREIRSTFGFPIVLSLLDVQIIEAEAAPQSAIRNPQSAIPVHRPPSTIYRPKAIVVCPDYLLDVSTVANCYQGNSAEPVVYLLQKFLPVAQTKAMLIGNCANFFLDELMHNPEASFKETFPKVFRTSPLAFSLLADAEIREIAEQSQKHWVTLQAMVRTGMRKFDIEPKETYLEPSFYDEKHGLQGRLDVFYKKENRSAIIELKSGKAFMPNRHGIGASHFIQTLLYDLMVRSVFGEEVEPASYILYSGLEMNQLKYAPPIVAEQYEALQIRNRLVAIDRRLAAIGAENVVQVPLLERIARGRFPHLKGYLAESIGRFEATYSALSDLERRYFNAFSGLIAREHQLAKTGAQGMDNANGLAALWLDTPAEKEACFDLFKSLKIKENRAFEDEPIIVFEKTADTSPLANFRVGDIAVLYPANGQWGTADGQRLTEDDKPSAVGRQPSAVLQTQIFKVTLLDITPETITVRLRYRQFNTLIFKEFELWSLEHDLMDSGYNALYQGLFRWAGAEQRKRDLLLGTLAPKLPQGAGSSLIPHPSSLESSLTDEQRSILAKMLSAPDYFLLWGPPGTGKTSQVLRHFAKWIFENTDENLLLLAYTNRAVDEICEALDSLGDEVKSAYLRIGSRYSTGQQFENQLLAKKIEEVTTRKGLKEVLEHHRIFVATLASLSNNLELLQLKKFRRVAIDEASQILEPGLVGLLPQFEQWVLIGDHKQLPAVVVQPPEASAVLDEKLHEIGLQNLRNSLFERLYRRAVEQGWHWAIGHLSHQGRMHEDIMRFPGEHFYEGKLRILPKEIPASQKQLAPLAAQVSDNQGDWLAKIEGRRIAFLDTPADRQSPSRKTNRHEAELLVNLVKWFQGSASNPQSAITDVNLRFRNPQSIGIITPYRAQIAQIQEVMQREGIDCTNLTIDTVERYQGGARDIILISLCVNAASQMETLVSLSEEGVDRKLNVALTRARERVVVLGCEEILQKNLVYRKFIEYVKGA